MCTMKENSLVKKERETNNGCQTFREATKNAWMVYQLLSLIMWQQRVDKAFTKCRNEASRGCCLCHHRMMICRFEKKSAVQPRTISTRFPEDHFLLSHRDNYCRSFVVPIPFRHSKSIINYTKKTSESIDVKENTKTPWSTTHLSTGNEVATVRTEQTQGLLNDGKGFKVGSAYFCRYHEARVMSTLLVKRKDVSHTSDRQANHW